MSVLIRGVRLYGEGDPVDVLIDDGQIADIGAGLTAPADADVIDADGKVLLPGFVDLHTHLREPGREYAEDIETGSAAAALGGYTAVFAMANTDPVADGPVVLVVVDQRPLHRGTGRAGGEERRVQVGQEAVAQRDRGPDEVLDGVAEGPRVLVDRADLGVVAEERCQRAVLHPAQEQLG